MLKQSVTGFFGELNEISFPEVFVTTQKCNKTQSTCKVRLFFCEEVCWYWRVSRTSVQGGNADLLDAGGELQWHALTSQSTPRVHIFGDCIVETRRLAAFNGAFSRVVGLST